MDLGATVCRPRDAAMRRLPGAAVVPVRGAGRRRGRRRLRRPRSAPRDRRADRRSRPRPAGFAAASSTASATRAGRRLGRARCADRRARPRRASMRAAGALAGDGILELDAMPTPTTRPRPPGRWPEATARPSVGYAWRAMSPTSVTAAPRRPADRPPAAGRRSRRSSSSTCAGLRHRWADRAALPPIGAEAMRGADRRAQALGVSEERLMEHAGTAVAAAVKALAVDTERWGTGPIVILCGPGNNGGDGLRRRPPAGPHTAASVVVAVVATEARPAAPPRPRTGTASPSDPGIAKVHAPVARDVAVFGQGIEKAAVIVDALLGTGVRGPLREPIRTAVEVIDRAHRGRHPGRRRRHPDRRRPLERRTVRPGRPGRSDRHVPPTQDRPARRGAARPMPARSWSPRSGSRRRPTVVEPGAPPPAGLAAGRARRGRVSSPSCSARRSLTGLLPTPHPAAIFHGPVLIGVLIVGTGWLLWRIAHGSPDRRRPVTAPASMPRDRRVGRRSSRTAPPTSPASPRRPGTS